MDDLNSSPLFDRRHIEFLRSILTGRPMNPISAVEQKFLKYSELIKTLDKELDRSLMQKMGKWQDYISVQEAVVFLLEAMRRKQLDDALLILDTSVAEERSAKFKDLMVILNEAQNMPASWALSLHAEEIDNRHRPLNKENISGLNLDAMRDFR